MRHWIDIINDMPLFEMAYTRKALQQRIRNLADPIAMHVIKIVAMPTSIDRDHWGREIYGWLKQIEDDYLKPKNKKFTASEYFELLFNEPFDNGIEGLKSNIEVLSDEGYPVEINDEHLYGNIVSFYREICELMPLSNHQAASLRSFRQILKDL